MALQKSVSLNQSGVELTYHKIMRLSVYYSSAIETEIVLGSFVSKKCRDQASNLNSACLKSQTFSFPVGLDRAGSYDALKLMSDWSDSVDV